MDFKSILTKLDSMETPPSTPAAPELPKAVQLNEDAELRVLAGTSSYVAEAKKKAEEKKEKEVEEGFDADAKVGDTFKTAKGTTTKTATGVKHTRDKYDYDPGSDDKDDKKRKEAARKAKKESVEPEFKSKFMKMVEAKKEEADKKKDKKKMEEAAKPDFLDMDKDGDKKEPMKKAVADKKKKGPMKEAEEKRAPAKKSEREVTLPSGAKTKATRVQGWQSQKADKESEKSKNESVVSELSPNTLKSYKAKADKEIAGHLVGTKDSKNVIKRWKGSDKADEKLAKKESVSNSKKVVAESVENKMSFREMMNLVVESGGQQQIDPLDKELFAWATRVAETKLGEGMKAEVYAGMVYERMGGRFEMYDVLSEDK